MHDMRSEPHDLIDSGDRPDRHTHGCLSLATQASLNPVTSTIKVLHHTDLFSTHSSALSKPELVGSLSQPGG